MQKDNLRKLVITTLAAGNNVLVNGGAGLGSGIGSIRVWQVVLVASAATTVQFLSAVPPANTTTTPASGPIPLSGAGSAITFQGTGVPWAECLPGQSLVLNTTTSNSVTGTIWYSLA